MPRPAKTKSMIDKIIKRLTRAFFDMFKIEILPGTVCPRLWYICTKRIGTNSQKNAHGNHTKIVLWAHRDMSKSKVFHDPDGFRNGSFCAPHMLVNSALNDSLLIDVKDKLSDVSLSDVDDSSPMFAFRMIEISTL